eukprot:scaffold11639_cov65-Phaeocystis_antarctica.AAC.1
MHAAHGSSLVGYGTTPLGVGGYGIGREGCRRLVEAAQHERRLRRRKQRQRPRVGVVRHARQRLRQRRQPRRQPCRQPLDALAREEVAVVLDRPLDRRPQLRLWG